MIRFAIRLMAAATVMWWASSVAAGPPVLAEESGRYQHTRCVVLASPTGPADLEALAEELTVLRESDVSAVVVLLAGIGEWTHQTTPSSALGDKLRAHTDDLRFEWRKVQPPSPWLADLGRPVRSALLEAAYWQDRGYRLLPFHGADRRHREAGATSREGNGTSSIHEKEKGNPSSGLRFHW